MPSWSGCIASETTSLKGGLSTSSVAITAATPAKWFNKGIIMLRTTEGVSGSIFCDVYAAVGGATFQLGGITAVTTLGNYLIGTTATAGIGTLGTGFPRPSLVVFGAAGGVGVGYTASVYLAGEY